MMNKLRRRWLTLGVVWMLVLAGTSWNIFRVAEIKQRRQVLENLKMDLKYLQANTAEIQKVCAREERLTHHVKSFGLGFLVVEDDLKQLSGLCGLTDVQIKTRNESQNSQSAVIQVNGTGTIPGLMRWLSTTEETYPYLSVSQLEMSRNPRLHKTKLKVTFNYLYSLTPLDVGGRI